MEDERVVTAPSNCPSCGGELLATRLECALCATEVNGRFSLGRLGTLREPHASLIEMFLRVRGNTKEMERELGLSYPTVRARLEEALIAAGFPRDGDRAGSGSAAWEASFESDLAESITRRVQQSLESVNRRFGGSIEPSTEEIQERESAAANRRTEILGQLERGEISAAEATAALRQERERRYS